MMLIVTQAAKGEYCNTFSEQPLPTYKINMRKFHILSVVRYTHRKLDDRVYCCKCKGNLGYGNRSRHLCLTSVAKSNILISEVVSLISSLVVGVNSV